MVAFVPGSLRSQASQSWKDCVAGCESDAALSMERWAEDLARIRLQRSLTLDELNKPPRNEHHRAWQDAVRSNLTESAALNKEIASAGVPFDVGELGSVRAPYPEIVPLLTRHLMLDYSRDVLGAIIAAMTVPYGDREALDALLGVLHEKRNSGDRDILFSVGNAIAAIAKGLHDTETLYDVASDPRNGAARSESLVTLATLGDERAIRLAVDRLVERDNPWAAMNALRKAKAWSARSVVEPYLTDETSEYRAEAKKFMQSAEKALARKSR